MEPILLSATEFCRLVDIDAKRFEQRRLRERAAADLRESIDGERPYLLPIAPTEPGRHARFDWLDAVRMRSVVELERAGMSFGPACDFIRTSGMSAVLSHIGEGDFYVARWAVPGGTTRQSYGTAKDLSRAEPEAPLTSIRLNVSAIADDIARRAAAQLGLAVRNGHFIEKDAAP